MKIKKRPNQARNRSGLIAALDVGTTKVCCFIARLDAGKDPRIVGTGHHESIGLQSGAIVDMDGAETSIRTTVEAAEKMAGENIQSVIVNLSGARSKSRLVSFEMSIAGHEIGDSDLRRILDPSGFQKELPPDHELVHAIPVGYSVDGSRGVRDPRGLYGQKLGVNLHVISAAGGGIRNLETSVARCHLEVEAKVLTPYASALACLDADEKQLGVTYVDMGGGTTSIAVFFDNELVYTGVIPLGGAHVTNDIARGLSTPIKQAERMKVYHGSALPSSSDDREVLKVPRIGEERGAEAHQIPRSMLVGIIRPRLEETLEMVRDRLADAGFDKVAGACMVLAGGASQLPGVRELTANILGKEVRMARPKGFEGLPEAVSGPAFAACLGLLSYAKDNPADALNGAVRPMEEPNGRFGRIGQWMRENF